MFEKSFYLCHQDQDFPDILMMKLELNNMLSTITRNVTHQLHLWVLSRRVFLLYRPFREVPAFRCLLWNPWCLAIRVDLVDQVDNNFSLPCNNPSLHRTWKINIYINIWYINATFVYAEHVESSDCCVHWVGSLKSNTNMIDCFVIGNNNAWSNTSDFINIHRSANWLKHGVNNCKQFRSTSSWWWIVSRRHGLAKL